jgi:hypothetical protein
MYAVVRDELILCTDLSSIKVLLPQQIVFVFDPLTDIFSKISSGNKLGADNGSCLDCIFVILFVLHL